MRDDLGRHTLNPLPDLKAAWLARWVSHASDEQLERFMRSGLRRLLVWQIFRTMGQRFDADRAAGLDAVVEFRIGGRRRGGVDRYQLALADGRCRTTRRGRLVPTLMLEMEGVAFLRLVAGATGAARLILGGRLRARGDLLLAARLPRLLNIPRSPPKAVS